MDEGGARVHHLKVEELAEEQVFRETDSDIDSVAPVPGSARDHTDIRRTERATMQAQIVPRDPRSLWRGPLSGFGLDERPA
jgi:hypothetical protein